MGIPGVTDDQRPRRLGPKRANKIRKLFNLEKKDDVRKFVVRREVEKRKCGKAPKIQRLVTATTLQRRRRYKAGVRNKMEQGRVDKAEYQKRLAEYHQQQREARAAEVAKKKKDREAAA